MRKKLSSTQYGKTYFAILIISILVLSFFLPGVQVFSGQGQGKPHVIAIQGRAKVEGHDAVVEILVAVQPGENAKEKAKEKLRRMYPDAEEIDSSNFSLTGLNWNVDTDFQINGDVKFVYNNTDDPVDFDGSVKYKSYNAWNEVGSSIFKFTENGTTSICPSLVKECKGRQFFNGENEIAWLDIRESSVLGVVWSGTSSTGPEFDMALDDTNFVWYVGTNLDDDILNNAIDLQTVWMHEFGHGLGLGHSNVSGSVMEAVYDGPRRVLHKDDIDGITSLYPASNVDLPPMVTITSPADGSTHLSGDSTSFAGTATDDKDGDLTASLDWTMDDNIPLGSGGSFSAVLSDGPHNITATVTVSNSSTGSDSVGVTVIVPGEGNSNDIYVWAIDFTEKRKGRKLDLITTVTIRRDSNADGSSESGDVLVGGATVQMTLTRDGASFDFAGTTNSEGIAKFTLQRVRTNTLYTATVPSVTHSTHNYNNLLNKETQDTHTITP